ncbi:MAG TPA: aspartate kinase [Erysipelothrix sp.]|nr:aspartate kinase [Erysipelothrix sp.]
MRLVQKYGGSSLADAGCIRNVADKISKLYHDGHEVVVVLSAQGKTTNELIEKAKELTHKPTKRELDMLLATGEQQSVALMSLALSQMNTPSVSLNAFQAGIYSDGMFGEARITEIEDEKIVKELEAKRVVIVTGFQAVNHDFEFTTLGRGGSDTSAVAIAKVIGADRCEIYSDVDGIYTADPRKIENAQLLKEIDYDSMLELSSLGAKVLHNRAVELAKKYDVVLNIKSSFKEGEGTFVLKDPLEKTLISGIVVDDEIATASLIGVKDKPGVAFKIFSSLAKANISIDIVLQSVGRDGTKDIAFTVKKEDVHQTKELLEKVKEELEAKNVIVNETVAKLSIVGAGLESNPMIGALVFESLYKMDINVDMIATSEIKMSLIVDKKDADKGAKILHKRLIDHL